MTGFCHDDSNMTMQFPFMEEAAFVSPQLLREIIMPLWEEAQRSSNEQRRQAAIKDEKIQKRQAKRRRYRQNKKVQRASTDT
jgi:hypothetical protein